MFFSEEKLRTPKSWAFGRYEEINKYSSSFNYSCIIKTSYGSGSVGVRMANSKSELLKIARKFTKHIYRDFYNNQYRTN